ncbi:MAG: response regulator transcription factor [bacterium]
MSKTTQSRASGKKKILIVDDHPLLREGLGRIINQQADLMVCADAGSAPAGLSAVDTHRPDAVIVDISLEEGSGLELIKNIHAAHPLTPILALSMHHEDLYADRAIMAGAKGYVMKRESADTIIAAIRKVLGGQLALSDNIVSRLVSRRMSGSQQPGKSPTELLSDRELEVYRCLGEGLSTSEVARKFKIAVSTVESHRARIKEKLDIRNSTSLVSNAARFVAESDK